MAQAPLEAGKASACDLPEAIEASLVASLYGDPRTLLIGSVGTLSAVFLTAWLAGGYLLPGCALAMLATTLLRVREMHAFASICHPITPEQLRIWEWRYVAGSTAYVFLMGLWCFLSFVTSTSAEIQLVSFATTLANMIGIAGRNFGSRRLVRAQLIAAGVPMLLALIVEGGIAYFVLAFVLLSFFVSLQIIADRLRATLADAVISKDAAQRLSSRLDAALNTMPHGLVMFDEQGRVVITNQRLPTIIDMDVDRLSAAHSIRDILRDLLQRQIIAPQTLRLALASSRRKLEDNDDGPVDVRLTDGRTLALSFRRGPDGAVALVEDTTEQRSATEKITYLAHNDVLTGLPNRAVFRNEVGRILNGLRSGERFAILFVDLDHFKEVNDTLGHPSGDQLLKLVANRLRGAITGNDIIARWGGDEFVIARPHACGQLELSRLAEAIVREVGRPYDLDGQVAIVGASVGIAIGPQDGADADLLLKNADLALYRSKAAGRGAWRFFEPDMSIEARARRSLELDLREALKSNSFELAYQPITDLRASRIMACEALLRWTHPERGVVSPAVFIPVAEEIGIIGELGEWVLRQACAEAKSWPGSVRVAVNLSPIQFRKGDIALQIRRALRETGLPADRLELEITESVFIQGESSTLKLLADLKGLGVRISLDDFGTGYSSLAYLQSFPLDKVKIDRSFLVGAVQSPRSLTLLSGIARLCRELDMSVVIEGVETQEQLDLVARLDDIAEVQGYLISCPVPGKAARDLIGVFNNFAADHSGASRSA